jgi:Cys-rich repeat protein
MPSGLTKGIFTAVIGAGVGLAAIALLRSSAKSPPPPVNCIDNSQCPPGEICQLGLCVPQNQGCTNNSQCPPGETCQNGTCAPCPVQVCSCSEAWDSADCVCSPLIPFEISAPVIFSGDAYFAVEWGCIFTTGLSYGIASSPSTAPCSPNTSTATLEFQVPLKVIDSAGHPICNQNIEFALDSPVSLPFKTADGNFVGTLTLSLFSTGTTTDAQGNATAFLLLTMFPDEAQTAINISKCIGCCSIFGCGTTSFQQTLATALEITLVSNPTIHAATTLEMDINICGSYNCSL